MSINDQAVTFGSRNRNRPEEGATGSKRDLPKAKFWLNIGYLATIGEEQRFVSLPLGIPLDTMEKLNTRANNQDYAQFQAMRNELLADMIEQASALEPGQEVIIACDNTDLAIQIRCVLPEPASVDSTPESRYAPKRTLFEVGKAA